MKSVKLGEYIKVLSPKTKIQAKKFLASGRHPIVSQEASYINGYWDNSDDVMILRKPVVIFGDHTRAIKYIDFDFVAGADGTKILVTPDDLDARYFYHWLLAHPVEHLGYARHFRLLKDMVIDIPSLDEQRRIVARLDAAFEKISAAEVLTRQNLDNVSSLQKSILQKYLSASGNTHRLGDICAILGGKRLPKGEKLLSTPTPHPYVRVTDFDGKGGVDTNDIRYISDSVYEKISRYIINTKDVFLSIAGTIGVTGIVPEMLDGANLTENACRLVPSDAINTRYLYYFTTSEIFRVQALAETKQTAQPKLALMRIKDIQIDLPSIEEQESIVMKLDNHLGKTQRAEAQYQKKLAKLTDLRQSLLAEAFSTTNTV
ncbi:restriction endonuclease subunit S [Patescibacteria group bacterium]|nr:restriction endonuclease subunit S [Patescibacteria group bacterium]